MSVGKNIARARVEAGLSQADLAKKIDKSRASVCEYESEEHDPPLAVLTKIAEVTGTTVAALVTAEPAENAA